MFELLELILNNLSFFASDNNSSNIDVTLNEMKSEPKVLATSPSGGEKIESDSSSQPTDSKKSKGDPDICKKLTEQVMAIQKTELKPLVTLQETSEDGRKHLAVSAGFNVPFIGDQRITGCLSYPAPAPGPDNK